MVHHHWPMTFRTQSLRQANRTQTTKEIIKTKAKTVENSVEIRFIVRWKEKAFMSSTLKCVNTFL